jgi:hypothetical protein
MARALSVCAAPIALGALATLLEDRGVSAGFVLLAVVCVVSAAGVIRRRVLRRPELAVHDRPDLEQAEPKPDSTKAKGTAAG